MHPLTVFLFCFVFLGIRYHVRKTLKALRQGMTSLKQCKLTLVIAVEHTLEVLTVSEGTLNV